METLKELSFTVFLFLVVLSTFDSTLGVDDKNAKAKKKLQIGVKKRVDNCQVKSKKGDFLHMHYKVR
jgi:peptidylprolyl isomerase/FK506-binding protein 2